MALWGWRDAAWSLVEWGPVSTTVFIAVQSTEETQPAPREVQGLTPDTEVLVRGVRGGGSLCGVSIWGWVSGQPGIRWEAACI